MTERTPIQRYADLLAVVSEHLVAHPHLEVFDLSPSTLYVHTDQGDGRAAAAALAAWFASVSSADLVVNLQVAPGHTSGYAEVRAYKIRIGGEQIRDLWGTVPGLQRWLVQAGWGRVNDGLRLTLADLEYFAEHGTLPEAGAR